MYCGRCLASSEGTQRPDPAEPPGVVKIVVFPVREMGAMEGLRMQIGFDILTAVKIFH